MTIFHILSILSSKFLTPTQRSFILTLLHSLIVRKSRQAAFSRRVKSLGGFMGIHEQNMIKDVWLQFKKTGAIDRNNGILRNEIADSWSRSKNYNVAFHETTTPMVNQKDFDKIYESKKELLTVAEPYIQSLYEMISGSKSYICIADENAVVLSSFYDNHLINLSAETFPLPGKRLGEESTGTNSVGLCAVLNKPFYVLGTEHYKASSHPVSCFSAPIHDYGNRIIGILTISGLYEETDIKLLALTTAMAGAIEREIRLRNAYQRLSQNNTLLKTTLDSISDGALLLDDQNSIIQANNTAMQTLSLKKSDIINMNINDIIPNCLQWEKVLSERKVIEDQEIRFQKNNKVFHLVTSVYPCKDSSGITSHNVVILQEMKDVRKLINKMTGSSANYTFDSIIYKSEVMEHVIDLAKRAAASDSTVLLRGESGTGKEVFAQAIHNASSKRAQPFITINCGALPRGLVESELFGYEGGAFTGSKKDGHPGKFELAEGGTIFFDEIGDMPLDLQGTLLRVLQNKEVTRIGGTSSKQINVRIIAATNSDLESKIQNSEFREDLYYRLNVFPLLLPPLRARREDISELAHHLAEKYCLHFGTEFLGFSKDAITMLENYRWPGNVRELENVIERAININKNRMLDINDFPINLIHANTNRFQPSDLRNFNNFPAATELYSSAFANDSNSYKSISRSEYDNLIEALTSTRGNVKDAASILGMSYRSVYRRLEKYDIDKNMFKNHTSV